MTHTQKHSQPLHLSNHHCPICASSSQRLFRKYNYWIRSCVRCQHRFLELTPSTTHVAAVYSDDYFQGGGAGYPDYVAEARLLRQQGRRYAELIADRIQLQNVSSQRSPGQPSPGQPSPGQILDVGAAAGFILQGFIDRGWQGNGIEPNPGMAAYARQLGLAVEATSLEQFHSAKPYDLITFIQVLPHFFDLTQALQVASNHTKPGGYWLIETWNRDSFTARILGKNWHEYSPPSVLHWFSPTGLRQLMQRYGMQEVARGRPAKWISAAHAKSLLRYKLGRFDRLINPCLNLIPDRCNIPYPAEDLIWMLFQKR